MMHQYGCILEDYKSNGALVNDCVFTLMHYVGGQFDTLKTLFQPNILKTFTAIIRSKFVISDVSTLLLFSFKQINRCCGLYFKWVS